MSRPMRTYRPTPRWLRSSGPSAPPAVIHTLSAADATEHIDQAVTDGKLTADQANERKSGLTDRITTLVNEGPQRGGREGGPPRDREQGQSQSQSS